MLHVKKGKGGNNEGTCTCALCARSEVSHIIFILHMCIDVQCTCAHTSVHVRAAEGVVNSLHTYMHRYYFLFDFT